MEDRPHYSVKALAFVGDAVFAVFIRQRLLRQPPRDSQLHALATGYQSATAQAALAAALYPLLDEAEADLFRRARNTALGHVPKSCTAGQYHAATALEALCGHWHMSGQTGRMTVLLEKAMRMGSDDVTALSIKKL